MSCLFNKTYQVITLSHSFAFFDSKTFFENECPTTKPTRKFYGIEWKDMQNK